MNEAYLDLNSISKQFSSKYFDDRIEDIKIDLIHYSDELNRGNLEQYNIIKMFEALMGYCGRKNIDLNKYFVLKF